MSRWGVFLLGHVLLEFLLLASLWAFLFLGGLGGLGSLLGEFGGPPTTFLLQTLVFANSVSFSAFHLVLAFVILDPISMHNSIVNKVMEDADIESTLFRLLYYRPLTLAVLGIRLSGSQ